MMEVDDNGGGSSVSEFKPKKWPQFIAGAFGMFAVENGRFLFVTDAEIWF